MGAWGLQKTATTNRSAPGCGLAQPPIATAQIRPPGPRNTDSRGTSFDVAKIPEIRRNLGVAGIPEIPEKLYGKGRMGTGRAGSRTKKTAIPDLLAPVSCLSQRR